MELPGEEDVSAVAFSLLILPITYNFHPVTIVDGKLGNYETNVMLTFDDINYIVFFRNFVPKRSDNISKICL